jgi:hypothetical protein
MSRLVQPSLQLGPGSPGFVFTGLNWQHHCGAVHRGTFEPEEVKTLSGLLKRVDVFIDGAANVRYFTCLTGQTGPSSPETAAASNFPCVPGDLVFEDGKPIHAQFIHAAETPV